MSDRPSDRMGGGARDGALPVASLPATREPLRVAARRLRWFRAALRHHLDQLEAELGCAFALDEGRLSTAFVAWLRAIEAHKPTEGRTRKAFFEFAAGLMLCELVRRMPVQARGAPDRAAPGSAAAFWPEGYAYTTFCLAVVAAALRQEFDEDVTVAPELGDLGHWWSFRENAAEDPIISIAFLDMFLGRKPDWFTPGLFSERIRRALARPTPPVHVAG